MHSLQDRNVQCFDELSTTLRQVIQCIESAIVLMCLFLFAKFVQMWFVMERVQNSFSLSERLIRVIDRHNSLRQTPTFSTLSDVTYAADTVERLVADGADVNQSSGKLLPLHCACVVGDTPSVKVLLASGAKVNILDGYERTALHYAAERSALCVDLLLRHGAQTDARDANKCTPLHWAAYKNRHQCARRLLEAGADPNAFDTNWDTPLSVAALKGHLEIARVLLDYNSNADVFNASGKSPLCRLVQTIAAGIGSAQDDALFALLLKACGTVKLRRFRCRPPAGENPHLGGNVDYDDNGAPEPAPLNAVDVGADVGAGADVLTDRLDIRRRLEPFCRRARSLLQLSRRAIRRHLVAGHVPTLVERLATPPALRSYVALRD